MVRREHDDLVAHVGVNAGQDADHVGRVVTLAVHEWLAEPGPDRPNAQAGERGAQVVSGEAVTLAAGHAAFELNGREVADPRLEVGDRERIVAGEAALGRENRRAASIGTGRTASIGTGELQAAFAGRQQEEGRQNEDVGDSGPEQERTSA